MDKIYYEIMLSNEKNMGFVTFVVSEILHKLNNLNAISQLYSFDRSSTICFSILGQGAASLSSCEWKK